MRRILLLLGFLALASSCVTTQKTAPALITDRLQTIAVVPIEAPPLLVHPGSDADRSALSAAGLTGPGPSGAAAFVLLPGRSRARDVAVVATDLPYLLSIAASSTPRKDELLALTKEQPDAWMPTVGLAFEAAEFLATGGKRQASVVSGYAKLPITDRSVNVMMENWYAPVRRWYNTDASMLDYAQQITPRPDAVLEVGVLNFEYVGDRMLFQVMVKLIDPTTGKVLARARETAMPKGKPLAEMLQNKGEALRDLIDTTAKSLMPKCLNDVGFVAR
jgi:hypothetical protein